MNAKARILATVASLGFMLFSFNHCVLEKKTNSKSTATTSSSSPVAQDNQPAAPVATAPPVVVTPAPTAPPMNTPAPPPVVIQSAEIDIGVKNFEEINETMSVVTGISAGTNAINNTFRELEVQLPTDNSIKSFLSSNQVAITKLAAEYCDQLVNSGTLRAAVWPGLNFGNSPNQVLANNTQKTLVINQTLDKFWGPNVGGNRTTSQLEMLSLMNDLLNGENLGSATTTQVTMKGVCTAALASAQVTLM